MTWAVQLALSTDLLHKSLILSREPSLQQPSLTHHSIQLWTAQNCLIHKLITAFFSERSPMSAVPCWHRHGCVFIHRCIFIYLHPGCQKRDIGAFWYSTQRALYLAGNHADPLSGLQPWLFHSHNICVPVSVLTCSNQIQTSTALLLQYVFILIVVTWYCVLFRNGSKESVSRIACK